MRAIQKLFLCAGILCVPSCKKYYDKNYMRHERGIDTAVPLNAARSYIRAITVYDGFETIGKFTALWLSDTVRATYAALTMRKRGVSNSQEQAFLKRQLEQNTKTISFYVINRYDFPLDEPNARWSLFLTIDGVAYQPIELYEVDLDPAYMFIFGDWFNRFKRAYKVVFDAYADDGGACITAETKSMALCFRCLDKQTALVWNAPGSIGRLAPVEPAQFDQSVVLSCSKWGGDCGTKKRMGKRTKK